MSAIRLRVAATFLAGAGVGAILVALSTGEGRRAGAQTAGGEAPASEIQSQLETITGKLPDQSHAMKDVGYHFSNLWFAAQQHNWPLAEFYNKETLSHLHWAVRIIPLRKDNLGQEIDLVKILEAFENGPWTQLKDAIAAKDDAAFDKAYRFTMETCYACHKAADKPYLRLQIPTSPEAPIMNFDPAATWPK